MATASCRPRLTSAHAERLQGRALRCRSAAPHTAHGVLRHRKERGPDSGMVPAHLYPLYTSRLASLHPLGLLTWRSSSATTFLCQTDRSVKLTDEHASWYTGPCRCGQQKRPYQKDSKDHQHLFKSEESY